MLSPDSAGSSLVKKATLYFVVFSVIASALNYCLYPILGRILPAAQYVDITVSLSLFTQVAAFLSSIIAITIGISKSGQSNSHQTIVLLQALLFRIFTILALCFLLAAPFIMMAIHTPLAYAIPIAAMMLFSIPLTVVSGYLNGKGLMVKLGLLTIISASAQFIMAITVAAFTRDGFLTMLSLTISQLIAIGIVYAAYRSERLPSIRASLAVPRQSFRAQSIKSLILYTIGASIAIMLISLVQVFDLLVAQSLQGIDLKLYTDVYVVSRAIFFAGMIFMWPFLGEVSLGPHRENVRAALRVVAYFAAITAGAVIAVMLFGGTIFHLLFGANYTASDYLVVSVLSAIFKFLMLIITAAVLYLIVRRHYAAIYYALGLSAIFFVFATFIDRTASLLSMLLGLNGIALFAIIVLLVPLLRSLRNSRTRRV